MDSEHMEVRKTARIQMFVIDPDRECQDRL